MSDSISVEWVDNNVVLGITGYYRQSMSLTPERARDIAKSLIECAEEVDKANKITLPTGIGAVIRSRRYAGRHSYVRVGSNTWHSLSTNIEYLDSDFGDFDADNYEILSEGVEVD